jgi:hypothetical protein
MRCELTGDDSILEYHSRQPQTQDMIAIINPSRMNGGGSSLGRNHIRIPIPNFQFNHQIIPLHISSTGIRTRTGLDMQDNLNVLHVNTKSM